MLLSGDPIDAEEALRIGLVNSVFSRQLMPAAIGLARKIASKAPIARALILDLVRRGASLPFAAAQDLEADLFGIAGGTEDTKAGLKAFLEKRNPQTSTASRLAIHHCIHVGPPRYYDPVACH